MTPLSSNDRVKFATYTRDGETGIDYAMNRYYSSGNGRFLTPDPYTASSGGPGVLSDPQSWNRYSYVQGDPINGMDHSGLYIEDPGDCDDTPEDCWGDGWGIGFGGPGGGGGGGGAAFAPVVLGPDPNWQVWPQIKKNVSAWDVLIAAALASESHERVSEPGYRYVAYIKQVGDCYRAQIFRGGSVVRERTYQAFDEFGQPFGGAGLTFTEHNYVQSGGLDAYNSSWSVNSSGVFTGPDILTRGGAGDTTEFQQFTATDTSGLDYFVNAPVMVLDTSLSNGPFFGTLGIVLRQHSVTINGNSGTGLPPCN